jgi:hypothetical protein
MVYVRPALWGRPALRHQQPYLASCMSEVMAATGCVTHYWYSIYGSTDSPHKILKSSSLALLGVTVISTAVLAKVCSMSSTMRPRKQVLTGLGTGVVTA